ncbi:hypothetical protein WMY93_026871 [Mugilogobius chulae]|uniref:Uncharacterized protein n=1 Tax=Mugilogobius chulae TaxID=88201 RepID=A0AAW0N352_9GOBI
MARRQEMNVVTEGGQAGRHITLLSAALNSSFFLSLSLAAAPDLRGVLSKGPVAIVNHGKPQGDRRGKGLTALGDTGNIGSIKSCHSGEVLSSHKRNQSSPSAKTWRNEVKGRNW